MEDSLRVTINRANSQLDVQLSQRAIMTAVRAGGDQKIFSTIRSEVFEIALRGNEVSVGFDPEFLGEGHKIRYDELLKRAEEKGFSPLLYFGQSKRIVSFDSEEEMTRARDEHGPFIRKVNSYGHDGSFFSLALLEGLIDLRHLDLWGLSDNDLSYISGLTNLIYLSIDGDGLTDEGLKNLNNLKNLRQLMIPERLAYAKDVRKKMYNSCPLLRGIFPSANRAGTREPVQQLNRQDSDLLENMPHVYPDYYDIL